MTPEFAALTEPLANGVHVSHLLGDASPDRILIFGAGPIGLLAMQALKLSFNSKIAITDRSESRLQLALSLGADAVFNPDDTSRLKEWAGDDGFPATVDAVGASATKTVSLQMLRPGGTAIWIGLHENTSLFDSYDLILSERTIRGSYACTRAELQCALSWIAEGKIEASSWTSIFSLEDSAAGFERMLNPGPKEVKGVIKIPQP